MSSQSENLLPSQITLAKLNGFISERKEVVPSELATALPFSGDHVLVDGEPVTAQICFDTDVHLEFAEPKIELTPAREHLIRPTLEDSRSLRKRIV